MKHTGRRALLTATCLLILVAAAGLLAVSGEGRPDAGALADPSPAQETVPAPTPELPVDPTPDDNKLIAPPPQCQVACELVGGPEAFCPGWNLWYSLRITNTGQFPVTNMVVSDTLPEGVWTAQDGGAGTVVGVYDPAMDAMVWDIPLLDVDETVELSCVLRTLSSVPAGATLRNTFTGNGFNLLEPIDASLTLVVDASLCAEPTPEPTPVGGIPTPNPPSDSFVVCMPVVVQ